MFLNQEQHKKKIANNGSYGHQQAMNTVDDFFELEDAN